MRISRFRSIRIKQRGPLEIRKRWLRIILMMRIKKLIKRFKNPRSRLLIPINMQTQKSRKSKTKLKMRPKRQRKRQGMRKKRS